LEVGVLESRIAFEAVTNHSIKTDVRAPNEGNREDQARMQDSTGSDQQGRNNVGVPNIINQSAEAEINQVTQHEKIGHKEQRPVKPPTKMLSGVKNGGHRKGGQAFELEVEPQWDEIVHGLVLRR